MKNLAKALRIVMSFHLNDGGVIHRFEHDYGDIYVVSDLKLRAKIREITDEQFDAKEDIEEEKSKTKQPTVN
jgi:hypothetical protein